MGEYWVLHLSLVACREITRGIKTAVQVEKLRTRFGLRRVAVGDRGVLTEARLQEELADNEGVDWMTALRPL